MHFDLSHEEQELLAEVLESYLANLKVEIFHTDHDEYKELLRHRQEVLSDLAERLHAATAVVL